MLIVRADMETAEMEMLLGVPDRLGGDGVRGMPPSALYYRPPSHRSFCLQWREAVGSPRTLWSGKAERRRYTDHKASKADMRSARPLPIATPSERGWGYVRGPPIICLPVFVRVGGALPHRADRPLVFARNAPRQGTPDGRADMMVAPLAGAYLFFASWRCSRGMQDGSEPFWTRSSVSGCRSERFLYAAAIAISETDKTGENEP